MTLQELTQLVSLGEGLCLEFKQKVPRPERIAKEVIALANTHGGRVLVGIGDGGTIAGVRDAEEEEYALGAALAEHCDPPVAVTTERIPVTAKRSVIVVHVPESTVKPHYLVDGVRTAVKNQRAAYIRVGDMSVEASPEAVRLMRQEKDAEDVLFEFGEKEQKLMRYLENYGRITVKQFASLAHIPKRQASHTLVLLTRANVLLLHAGEKEDYFTLAYGLSS